MSANEIPDLDAEIARVAARVSDATLPFAVIDETSIHHLVHVFYGTVRKHPRLGEIFERRLEGHWDEHLAKLESFWQAVLLKNGAYSGRPVPAHLKQKELVSSDYGAWLGVFRPVARTIFAPELAEAVIAVAERIAQSLWLATFGMAGAMPPAELTTAREY